MAIDIDRIREALSFVPSSDRATWLRMGMAVKSELGDAGFDLWNTWSQQDNSYNLRDAQDVWKSIRDGEVTIGTLYYEAKSNGWYDNRQYHDPDSSELTKRKRNLTEHTANEEKRISEEQIQTALKAQEIWNNATEVNIDNPYLIRKGVSPVQTMREIHVNKVTSILGYSPQSKGEQLMGRLLVIPIKVNGKLSTLELIDETGRKAALAGRGTKAGGYWAAQPLPNKSDEDFTVLIAEGAITALSAKKASGHYAIATLSSGNLLAVATTMHKRYPLATLIVLADLVKVSGEADPHAIKAAQAVDGILAIPNFGNARSIDDKDFNDMFMLLGVEAVKQAIDNAVKPIDEAHQSWLKPQPLLAKVEPEPYPLDVLPEMIRAAVEEVHGFTKAPIPLVVSSALAALSLAAQTQADAKRAEKLSGPISLFLLTIADSGERKSTCDGFFNKAIRDYDKAQAELAKPAIKDYKAAVEAWEAKRFGIKDKIRHLAKEGNSTLCMENALRELEHEKPEPPRVPRLIYSDATPEALAYSLSKTWPSGGVVSAEAGIVFGSHGMGKDSVMRNLALLNVLWDGGEITIDRRTTESFIVRGVRLTVGLQVQEATLHDFFDRSGGLARGTGFLARFLVSWPESTQGYRSFTDAPTNWPALEAFNRQIAEILDQPVLTGEDGILKPVLLGLSTEAKAAWVEFHDLIESKLVSGGELYDVRDVASKIADNAARLAALFHLFEMQQYGDIGLNSLGSASKIVAWHLNEARRFFGELALPVEMGNAIWLDNWLISFCQRQNTTIVPRREVQRNVTPVHLRQQSILDNALRELIEADRVLLRQKGRRKEIHVNPAIIGKMQK